MNTASKQWEITRAELRREPILKNRLYNAEKYAELNEQLQQVAERFAGWEDVKTLTRMVVEETTNIINHNKTWEAGPLKVRSKFNDDTGNIKLEILYAGHEYYDPDKTKLQTVIGSAGEFAEYTRDVDFGNDGTQITLKIRLK